MEGIWKSIFLTVVLAALIASYSLKDVSSETNNHYKEHLQKPTTTPVSAGFMPATNTPTPIPWETPNNRTNDSSTDYVHCDAAFDPGGSILHVVYQKRESNFNDNDIYYTRADMRTATPTWATPVNITDGDDEHGVDPAVSVDSDGVAHVVYSWSRAQVTPTTTPHRERTELIYTNSADWDTKTTISWIWSHPLMIDVITPEIVAYGDELYVCWSSHFPPDFAHVHKIFYNYTSSGTWQTPIPVTKHSLRPCTLPEWERIFEWHPEMALSTAIGNPPTIVLHFVYEAENEQNNPSCPTREFRIRYKTGDLGSDFQAINHTDLSSNGADHVPQIISATDGIHVIWRQENTTTASDRGVFYKKWTSGGGWASSFRIEGPDGTEKTTSNVSGASLIATFPGDRAEISFKRDSNGELHVIYAGDSDWSENDPDLLEVYYTWGSGTSANNWHNPYKITQTSTRQYQHMALNQRSGTPYSVFDVRTYAFGTGYYWDIYFNRQQ